MIMKPGFLLFLLLCWPVVSMADEMQSDPKQSLIQSINDTDNIDNAIQKLNDAYNKLVTNEGAPYSGANEADKKEVADKIATAVANAKKPCDETTPQPTQTELSEDAKKKLQEKEDAYNEAKENEQSLANRTLTALTTATTGIGGMELAMGLAQQNADKNAEASMNAYIATFRCTYGDGYQVKGGPEEIELPGANNQNLMNLRTQYIALANDLKERKAALDMAPGIESEVILDKSQMGLYDDENVGITSGAYESLYRAKMLSSEEDQEKIDEQKDASKKRVIAGGVLVGAGTVIGVGGNMLLNNDEIKEKIKELKEKRDDKKEAKALEKLKDCLKEGGATNTDSLSFSTFKPSVLNLNKIKCDSDEWKKAIDGRDAKDLIIDGDDETSYVQSYSKFLYGEDNNKQTNIADILFKNIKK